ncbi:hypothetical protein ABMA32_21890 [Mesorhizobium sp. VNQ89]|uniref:hypothetical protein n=1 Tax=Mesorhizobium quangtriensis TaxID=3157709 RepID=UPI0032B7BA8C
MMQDDWDSIRKRSVPLLGSAGMSVLRVTLLFGSAAAALALILAPVADRYSRTQSAAIEGVDYMSTGSIAPSNSYTIRRSVLQKTGAVCIIRADGRQSGDC